MLAPFTLAGKHLACLIPPPVCLLWLQHGDVPGSSLVRLHGGGLDTDAAAPRLTREAVSATPVCRRSVWALGGITDSVSRVLPLPDVGNLPPYFLLLLLPSFYSSLSPSSCSSVSQRDPAVPLDLPDILFSPAVTFGTDG